MIGCGCSNACSGANTPTAKSGEKVEAGCVGTVLACGSPFHLGWQEGEG